MKKIFYKDEILPESLGLADGSAMTGEAGWRAFYETF
jgi:hypothetical protein